MAKSLKRYNEQTKEWEIVSAPDVSVIQHLDDGSDISDTNVVITNYNYFDGEEKRTLNDTLTVINDDISKLQRNVSWLAEHGGGGGAGGGGAVTSYGIELDTPSVENGGSIYLRKEDAQVIEVKFRITGGADGDICKYTYQYDNSPQSSPKEIETNKYYTIKLDNASSTTKEHYFILRATNPYGTSITPFRFFIYESSLSLSFGGTLINNIYYVMQNSTDALIPINIVNGLMASETSILAECRGLSHTLSFTNTTTSQQTKNISFWDIIPKATVSLDGYYLVKISGQAILGNNRAEDEGFLLRIKVVSPSEITITMGANGNGINDEYMDAEQDSTLNYNFRVYAPASIDYLYYSAKIVNGLNSYLILGKYYDDDLRVEGASYSDNQTVKKNVTVNSQYTLDAAKFSVGDSVRLCVKVWSMDGTKVKESEKLLKITDSSKSFWPRQYEDRSGNHMTPNTMFASWNKTNVNSIDPTKWESNVTNYAYISDVLEEMEGKIVDINMNLVNGNDASGIQSAAAVPYMRLQNHAYATVELGKYYDEIKLLTMEGTQSFTFSITVDADQMAGTNHTILLWGQNNYIDDTISNGIRIDADKVYWAYRYESSNGQIASDVLTCNMPQNMRTTIDFSYSYSEQGSTVKIYKNGVMNAIRNIKKLSDSEAHVFPSTIYFGVNNNDGVVSNFADMNLYEFSIYTKVLNDIQVVVNSKNARLEGTTSDAGVISDYKEWLGKNFIPSPDTTDELSSIFFENGKYITGFDYQTISNISSRSNIPTITMQFADDAGFTEDVFYQTIEDTTVTANTYYSDATYFDPTAGQAEETILKLNVSLQGTSTLLYRVKNLELRMAETVTIDGQEMPVLFQPKKAWFPEKQFTLKADVVDSAHANNAVIGEWINNQGKSILSDNPAMAALSESTRPKDVDLSGNVVEHMSSITSLPVDYDEDVTIKHTLEGFPCLVFIKFSGNNKYTFVGIYSFNLGRYSYYNMGMKFLQCFSRRDDYGAMKACPSLIRYYKEKDNLGDISASNVYSFEFDNDGNENSYEHPMWSQPSMSIVKSFGEFKYPENIAQGDSIWNGLQNLFAQTSQWRINSYYGYQPTYDDSGVTKDIFFPIDLYEVEGEGSNKRYINQGVQVTQKNDNYTELTSAINVRNATAYFMIANAFGMTDSLGKNMTLRTWDGGRMWWPCFYDMDTALGIANDGTESIMVTALMDKLSTAVDDETRTTKIVTSFHDKDSQYGQHLSKLWGIFRSDSFLNAAGRTAIPFYEQIWETLRSATGELSSADNFTAIMKAKVDTCGELVFNYDYDAKYVQKPDSEQGDATKFLHGTRVDYIKDWLKKHFYFLDGVFDTSNYPDIPKTAYVDSPYYKDTFITNVNYAPSIDRIAYNSRVITPTFLKLSIGNAKSIKVYIDTENKDTSIYIPNTSSANSWLSVKGASLLSKFDGLQGGFQKIGTNAAGVVKALSDFNVSSSSNLLEDPVDGVNAFVDANGVSALESVDLSGTRLIDSSNTYKVDLSKFEKLLSVNIQNSDVTSLVLPNTALNYLYVSNSNITDLTLNDQSKLQSVDLEGCNRLNSIRIEKCNAFKAFTVSGKQNLASLIVTACDSLEELVVSSCTNLTTLDILNNKALKKITIADCTSASLKINIIGCAPESIVLNNVWTTNTIRLPERENLSAVTYLDFSNILQTAGFYYGSEEVERYGDGGDYILDLSPMTSLNGNRMYVRNVNVKYVRFKNDPDNPVELYAETFYRTDSIVRVFGHIKLMDSALSNKPNFFINHDMRWARDGMLTDYSNVVFDEEEIYNTDFGPAIYKLDGIAPLFVNDAYYTNITPFTTPSISGWFSNTKCDINDAYYVLSLCNAGTTNISNLFTGCASIEVDDTDFLDINTFAKCTNVTNINGVFLGCHIDSPLFYPLLEPLIENITEFRNVFGGNYKIISERSFFPAGCKISILEGFSPNVGGAELIDNVLLTNLSELSVINNSFNECSISFYGGLFDATELFRNNTKLTEIRNSFLKIAGSGSIANLFGGYSDEVDKYPSGITTIAHAFVFREGSHDPVFDGDDSNGVLMPLGNSFFRRIAGSLRYVTGNAPGSNNTYNDDWTYGSTGSFAGPGILKFLSNFESLDPSYPGMDDCDGDVFPYRILEGCANLVEATGLFENAHNFKNYNAEEGKEDVISVTPLSKEGVSLFRDCKKLKNISRFFRNMSSSIHCTLTGGAFKDCELINVDGVFDGVYLDGKIPFRLFYEEGENAYTISGLSAEQAAALGITDDEGTLDSIQRSDYSVYEGTYKYDKATIQKMSETLANLSVSSSMTAYSVANDEFENVICDNDKYSPYEYVLDGLHYEKNTNKHRYAWNKFAYDGSTDFVTRLMNSSVWAADVDRDNLPAEFVDTDSSDIANWTLDNAKTYTGFNFMTQAAANRFAIKNYFCPPDIFKYCANAVSTTIAGALSRTCGTFVLNGNIERVMGSIGRIPEFIFEPVSEIAVCSRVFEGCETMLPDTWGSSASVLGRTYPLNLFACLTKVEDLSGIFSGTRVWKYTQIPSGLFAANGTTLASVASMWSYAIWRERGTEYYQLPIGLFNGCGVLQNVSGMLGESRGNSIATIDRLFTYTNNSRINNCSSFLIYAQATTGNVPTFWEDWTGMNGNMSFFGIVSPYSYSAMKAKFANWEKNVPLNYYTNQV